MNTYLFDLDGTLVDSRPGLFPSFEAGLKAVGISHVSAAQLGQFLGTPLPEMFRALKPDISSDEIGIGIKAFRAEYERDGIAKNSVYPGVVKLLDAICRLNRTIWIVTSKPEPYAIQVVKQLALDRYVAGVIGAGMDEKNTKSELVSRALITAKADHVDTLMVGDRHYDVTGAIENAVLPIGALWGYGQYDELYGAGCRLFADSADGFRKQFVEAEQMGSDTREMRRRMTNLAR